MNPKVLIGQMAKLHNISAQTLRYYDNIDLFKPMHIDKENNYRFYGVEQFAHLDSILFLRALGLTLEEINTFLVKKDLDTLISILNNKEIDIENEIEILKTKLKIIKSKVELINQYKLKEVFHVCRLKHIPNRKTIKTYFNKSRDIVEFEFGIKQLSNTIGNELCLFNGLIGIIIDKQMVKEETFDYWEGVTLLFEEEFINSEELEILPAGQYATIVFEGSYDKGKEDYLKLLQWIKENDFEVTGDAYLVTITDVAFSKLEKEYITEIQIPIRNLNKNTIKD